MTPQDLLAEQFDHGTTDDRVSSLHAWTPAEQQRHRAELLAAQQPAPKARRPRAPRPRDLPPPDPGVPSPRNQQRPSARRAKGTTLDELLAEDWGT